MINAGFYPGDLVRVDRSVKPTNGSVVVAVLDGELSIKILEVKKDEITLLSANKDYSSVHVSEEMDLIIWGVCIHSIHKLHNN
jgi:DNA polymerase V